MKKLLATSLVAISALLSACGGGSSDPVQPAAAAASAPVVKAADVTVTQLGTVTNVTPGETFSLRSQVDCPLNEGGYCKAPVLSGMMRLESNLDLRDIQLFVDGIEIQVSTSYDGTSYRVMPVWMMYFWRPSILEVRATLSPWATNGDRSVILAHVASAEDDKKIVTSGVADTVSVLALPYQAPVVVSNVSDWRVASTQNGEMAQRHMELTCKPEVSACTVDFFSVYVNGANPGSTAYVIVNGSLFEATINSDGWLNWGISPNAWFAPGQTIVIELFGEFPNGGGVFFNAMKTSSGGKAIAPQLPKNCDAMIYDVKTTSCRGIG